MGAGRKDPVIAGCASDAITVSSQTVSFGSGQAFLVELRWSPSCQTNWARAQVTSGSGMTLAVHLEDTNGGLLLGTAAQGSDSPIFGPLWFAPTQMTQACVDISGSVRGGACTKPA